MKQYTFLTEIKFLDSIVDAIRLKGVERSLKHAKKVANRKTVKALDSAGSIVHPGATKKSTKIKKPFSKKLGKIWKDTKEKSKNAWEGTKKSADRVWNGKPYQEVPVKLQNINPKYMDTTGEVALGLGAAGLGGYGIKSALDAAAE